MNCTDYYKQCTKKNDPGLRRERNGIWRFCNFAKYTHVEQFADFLVGVYLVEQNVKHKRSFKLCFNDTKVNLDQAKAITVEDLQDDNPPKDCNLLPEPLPLCHMPYTDVKIKMKYLERDERFSGDNYKLLLVYDYNDKDVVVHPKMILRWRGNIVIAAGTAAATHF